MAKNYQQVQTKLNYNIQFGIAPSTKSKLIYNINNTSFSTKFDETNNMVCNQLDEYVQYWSKIENKVVNSYCISLFINTMKFCNDID